jgi:hypothetical protein
MLCPINFSIPKEKICTTLPTKTKMVSDLIPGDYRTYIYNTEESYYDEYKKSYFAITHKKSGWDCMRHYEILANACIPYFIDLEKCPENTMTLLPKELLMEGNQLYHKFVSKRITDLTEKELGEYTTLQIKLLEYTQSHLTTSKMAEYILKKTSFTQITRVLYLSFDTNADYLRCLTLHGFKVLFGSNCHEYPKISHIYKSDANHNHLYGKGISYSKLLDPSYRNDALDDSLTEHIKNKYYDVVVYGSLHRGLPFYELIRTIYKPHEIILLCGEDLHCCNCYDYINNGNTVFVREL